MQGWIRAWLAAVAIGVLVWVTDNLPLVQQICALSTLLLFGWAAWTRRAAQTQRTRELAFNRQQALMDSIDDLAWLKDEHGRFVLVNKKFGDVFGVDPQSLIGKTDFDISPPDLASHYQSGDQEVMKNRESLRVVEQVQRPAGEVGWAETIKVPVFSPEGAVIGTAGVARDITARKEAEQKIAFLARHDPLTGLSNRLHMEEHFQDFMRLYAQFAVLFLDLDNFKMINDTDGHSIGDTLLRTVATRLKTAVEDKCILVRLGGDEFLVLYPHAGDPRRVEAQARRLASAVTVPYLIGESQYVISASIGIALYPSHGEDHLTLIKHADIAMFQAKKNGRNRFYWFRDEMAVQTAAKRQMEMRLRNSLENRLFVLHYQPIIDTHSERIIGMEALVRMVNPEGGLTAPGAFITLAEETGLIQALGEWILRAALRQQRLWRAQGWLDLRMAVNISGLQFQQEDFVDRLAKVLFDEGLPGSCLELELTEGVLMAEGEEALRTLERIKALGVRLSIDDFGTGFSSLSYLKRLPIDRLKIDRSFVDELPEHPGDAAITQTIIHLAKSFNLEVVAEGVEQPCQLEFLRQLGCDAAQGYLFSPAVPADQFEDLLKKSQAHVPV